MSGPMVRGVIFDVDGTLVDSNGAHAQAWAEALGEAGFDVPSQRVRPLIGMGGDKLLLKLTGLSEKSERGKRISERRQEIFLKRYLPDLRPFPRAHELVARIHGAGLKMAVASSAHEEELEGLLRLCGAEELLGAAAQRGRSKPDPDVVHGAVTILELPAAEAVMIGDTPYDIEAAARAGVRAIALRCGGWDDAHLRGAAAIYDDPAELLDRYDESLLGR